MGSPTRGPLSQGRKTRATWIAVVVVVSCLLFGYVVARAALIPITWDEAYNYLRFTREDILLPFWHFRQMAANNHYLNTWLTWITTGLFGVTELTLRLPALLAYLLYLYYTARLAGELPTPIQRLSAFLVLNGNPYMLDFFSLARGYGLAYGLLAGSLWYLYRFLREGQRARDSLLSLGFAILAVAAHLTLIHFLLALTAAFVLVSFLLAPSGLGLRGRAAHALRTHAPGLVLVAASLVPAAFVIRKLREAHALFYGGTTGFWHDSLAGSLNAWLYQEGPPGALVGWLGGLVVVLMVVAVVVSALRLPRRSGGHELVLPALVFILISCALASVVQHHVLGVRYLLSRTATYLLLLAALILVLLAADRSRAGRAWRLALPVLAAAVTLNLLRSMNLTSALEWRASADVKRMLADVAAARRSESDSVPPTVLGIGLDLEAPINFYRLVDRLTWLNVADRRMKSHPLSDFYLYAEDDWRSVNADSFVVLKGYRAGSSRLLRRRVRPSRYDLVVERKEDYERHAEPGGTLGTTSKAVAYSGTRSGLTDRRHRRSGSIGLTLDLTDAAADRSLIRARAMIWMESLGNATAQLVVVFEREGKPYSWQSMAVQDVAPRARSWFSARLVAFVPPAARSGDRVSVYVENRQGPVYIDDLDLRWMTAIWPVPSGVVGRP